MAKRPVAKIEEWRAVFGRPGYEASSLGRVRSVDRWINYSDGRCVFFRGAILRQSRQGHYLKVSLGKDGTTAVHIAVCLAFHGPRPSQKHSVAHWNGDCHDNRPSNLRWATQTENKSDEIRHGTRRVGSRNGAARFSEADIRTIRKLRATTTLTLKEIAERYGTHYIHISRIVQRHIWRHVP